MLLNELTGIKKYYNKNEFQLERILGKFGIRCIAAGKYGRIFTNPNWNYVVKMFRDDPYYLSFVNYAMAHPNAHYPKFIRKPLHMHAFHKRFRSQTSLKFWLVKIEKLSPINDAVGSFITSHLERAVQFWYNVKHKQLTQDQLDQDWTYVGSQKVSMYDLFKRYPWLWSLAEAWHNIFENIEEGSPDIHAGNFMQRSDGTIVIIDPLWQGTNPLAEYQKYIDRESASGYDEYEEQDIKGPEYVHKKQQAAIEATRSLAKQIVSDGDDDIPF